MLWQLLPFHICSFPIEWMDYQLDSLFEISNDVLIIFQKLSSNFIHLNVNSLLSKKDETRYIAKLTNATVIGLSESKLNNTVLNSERDQSRRGSGLACFVKNSISYNRKSNSCINTESVFREIFLPKSKQV